MRPSSSRFSPRLLPIEELESLTVGRTAIVERLVGNLAGAIVNGQGRFDLVVGPRGVGKSHLFRLVAAGLGRDEALGDTLVCVALAEEFHPSSLLHLLAKILEAIPGREDLPPVRAQLQLLRKRDKIEAEELAVEMIRGRLGGRALLVMLENLDEMLKDLGRKAQARLRKIVQTEGSWSVFATARSAKGVLKQNDPFHGTFVVSRLEPLSAGECRDMMIKLAKALELPTLGSWLSSSEGFGDVRVIRQLLGGSPRVMSMILQHMDPEQPGDLYASFYGLAEEVTPYYQEQIGRLSAGQKPVMEFLAERWTPASVREIADGLFADPVSISTHLRALRRDRLVTSTAVGKERFYEIADPIHRIARAMKREDVLSQALARIAKIWSLVCRGERIDAEQFLASIPARPEGESEYVNRIAGKSYEIVATREDSDPQGWVDRLIACNPDAEGFASAALILALMQLGRDEEALTRIERWADTPTVRAVYTIGLANRLEPERAPLSFERLRLDFDEYLAAGSTGELGRILGMGDGSASVIVQRLCAAHGSVRVLKCVEPFVTDLETWSWVVFTAWIQGDLDELLRWLDTERPGGVPPDASKLLEGPARDEHSIVPGVVHDCLKLEQAVLDGRDPGDFLSASPAFMFWVVRHQRVELFAQSSRLNRLSTAKILRSLGLGKLLEPFESLIAELSG